MNCNAKSLDLLCQGTSISRFMTFTLGTKGALAIFVETYARDKAQRIFVIKSKEQFDRFTASCLFAGEHVEHLSISGEAGWRATYDDCFCLMRALMRMPRLKRLELKTPGLHRPIIIATLYTHATALEELHIKMDNLDDPYNPADLLVPQILTSEVGSLRLVHFLGSPPHERDEQPVIPYPQEYVDAVALLLQNSANTIKQLHIRAPHPTQIFARTRHPLQFPNLEVLTMFGTHIDRSPCFMQVQNHVTYLELSLADTDSGPGGFLFNIGLLERLGQCFPSLTTLKLIAQSEDGPDVSLQIMVPLGSPYR